MWFDQCNQTLPGHDPIHLDQEQFLAGLLALTGVLGIGIGIGEGHLLHHRKARRLVSGDFAKSGSLFQSFPKGIPSKSACPPTLADQPFICLSR